MHIQVSLFGLIHNIWPVLETMALGYLEENVSFQPPVIETSGNLLIVSLVTQNTTYCKQKYHAGNK